MSTDSVTIIVTCDGKNLFVPNTFSPNGDGVNDQFFVSGKGLTTIQTMRVFNRWGQMVFEKRNFAPNDPKCGLGMEHSMAEKLQLMYTYILLKLFVKMRR